MEEFQTFILLMFAATIIVGISQKLHIPYPVGLVLGGAAIGFIPNHDPVNFDPNLILVVVLPPILYYAAFDISLREFKRNWRDIISLALGLVIFTTFVIGIIFKWLFPELPWALAFIFGAIISPPDAIAATTILKRFAINNRLLTVLEGESLINDASALVLYRIAVVALLSGVFSFAEASIDFAKVVTGGIFVGIVTGYLIQKFSRRYLDPVVGVLFSFTIPYITYILAMYVGVSGVLAVVANGLIGSQIIIRHHSSLRRILGFAVWDIFIILMNCFVFILIGLQLPTLTKEMTYHQLMLYSAYALLITFTMIILRVMWVYAKSTFAYVKALSKPNAATICPHIIKDGALIGWSGMRGIVSLAAALGLPYNYPNEMSLEGRSEVIFITFMVILMTLLIPGLTLSSLIRWLNIEQQTEPRVPIKVKKQLTKVAQKTIHRLHSNNEINETEHALLSDYFKLKNRVFEITTRAQKDSETLETAKSIIIQEQRKELFEIWERLEIDDKQLQLLEQELDFEETHFARAVIN